MAELTIPGSIKNFNFSLQNSNITKLTLAEGVESIIQNSPVANTPVEEIILPSTLKTLGTAAFSGATQLKTINLPEGVTFADNATSIFSDCPLTLYSSSSCLHQQAGFEHVHELHRPDQHRSSGFRHPNSFLGVLRLHLVDNGYGQSPITKIEANAFQNCTALETIPDLSRVTELGASAFYECKALRCDVNLSSLKKLEAQVFCYTQVTVTDFCDTLESIDDWALIQATVKAELPPTLQSIGSYAFFSGNLPRNTDHS